MALETRAPRLGGPILTPPPALKLTRDRNLVAVVLAAAAAVHFQVRVVAYGHEYVC